jgi:NAD(P)-dependent dehydrogenase (short-subunit alcohol dehydrogenase family)
MNRYARADEIAALVAFLTSEESGTATGASWTTDGGLTA